MTSGIRRLLLNDAHKPMEKGFTLLEIIISIGLSAFLLSIAYSTYFGINKSISATAEEQAAIETGRMMLALIRRDLQGVLCNDRYPLRGQTEERENDTNARIEFITASSFTEEHPRLNRVMYALIPISEDRSAMIRLASRNLTADLLKEGSSFEVSRNIANFSVEFYDGSEWFLQWDSGKEGKVPHYVRLTVEIKDLKGKLKTFVSEESMAGGT